MQTLKTEFTNNEQTTVHIFKVITALKAQMKLIIPDS